MDHCYIGIDIGGTNLRTALLGSAGNIIHRSRTESVIERGRDEFCRRLLNCIEESRHIAISEGMTVVALGVGVPGLVDRSGVIHSSVNMRPLDGFNLADYIEQAIGLPTVCGNDANLIAVGEHAFGAARCMKSFVAITVGTGLGSGLMLDGKLWVGAHGFAAEFGHVTVEPEGYPCSCGNSGCLEQYVSAGALVRMACEQMSPERQSLVRNMLDAADVAKLARNGDLAAQAAFEQSGRKLGAALASLVNTLDLEGAVICGGVAASFDLFASAVRTELGKRCFPEMASGFIVTPGELGDDAGLMGAALWAQMAIGSDV